MVVQVTNTGGDLGSNVSAELPVPNGILRLTFLPSQHFDLQMPGGGVGIFNGCASQFGSWNGGQQYGGVGSRSECDNLPSAVRQGCYWRFDWFKGADNPNMTFQKVTCPAELVAKSGCKRNDASTPTTLPPSSSTSSTSTTPSSSSSSSSSSGGGGGCTAAKWAQCAGIGYSGCTTCESGSTCTKLNDCELHQDFGNISHSQSPRLLSMSLRSPVRRVRADDIGYKTCTMAVRPDDIQNCKLTATASGWLQSPYDKGP